MNPVYIYSCPDGSCNTHAVHPECLKETRNYLIFKIARERIIDLPDQSYLNRELPQKKGGALIMPGGSFIHLSSSFRDNGGDMSKTCETVKNFVSQGGNYLGTCSGAMLASETYSDERHERPARSMPFFLSLLPTEFRLPVYPVAKTQHYGGDNRRVVPILTGEGESLNVLWNEGCKFTFEDKDAQNLRVEARYGDLEGAPIAALSGKYGAGNVFIQGVHPELKLPDEEKNNTTKREQYMNRYLEKLGITEPIQDLYHALELLEIED